MRVGEEVSRLAHNQQNSGANPLLATKRITTANKTLRKKKKKSNSEI